MAASTGTVGDLYGNVLAENVNGSNKNELIHNRRWDDGVEVEIATFKCVSWWNETRLYQSLGYRTPVEVETAWVQTVVAPLLVRRCCYGTASAGHFCVVIGVG
ncbi:integrase core domain-containing protein [Corynebacterium striatum]|uniref:integrase core domain-containing protein n=1 Tax=Corynebacterium striatum TaxID=43770 RepID=UPI003B5C5252